MADTLNGNGHQLASFLKDIQLPRDMEIGVRGNDGQINWVAPNKGAFPLSHIATYQAVVTTAARTYREYDEAVRASLDNARFMRNDCGIMECLESRQRCTALLDWHIEPENDTSQEQNDLAADMTKILAEICRFTEYRRCLLEAIWFGKHGIQNRYGWQQIGGQMRVLPTPRHHMDNGWMPIHGDKIVFRFDDGNLPDGAYDGQMGIRVGMGHWGTGDIIQKRWKVEATDRGMAYFLSEAEQKLCVVHSHMIEDAAFEDVMTAGALHGIGVRSRIYWEWVQKQESLAFLMEYLERSAGGIELWSFPAGNDKAKEEVRVAATERLSNSRNVTLVPIPAGDEGHQYGVQIIEPGMAGIETLKDILQTYFGHRIKRYILGQTLTSEADATGLGSGVADLHLDTLLQIIKYDATNLEETITRQLLRPMQQWNFPKSRHIRLKFKIDTEDEDMEAKLEAYQKAYSMGLSLKAKDVADMIGASLPGRGDEVLSNKQQMPGAGGANPFGGDPGSNTPRGEGGGNETGNGSPPAADTGSDNGSLSEPAPDANDVTSNDSVSRASRALYHKMAEPWTEEDEAKHPREADGKFAPSGHANETGKHKVKLDLKQYGNRWYALADLPNGDKVTRSHEDKEEARRLATKEIQVAGHELEDEEPPQKVSQPEKHEETAQAAGDEKTPEKAQSPVKIHLNNYGRNRWYALADLPDGSLVTRSHEDRAEARRLAAEEVRSAGHAVEEEVEEKAAAPVEQGPHEGEKNADGLVFRDGRWHREETELPAASPKPGPKADPLDSLSDMEREIAEEAAGGNLADLDNDRAAAIENLQDAERYYTKVKKPAKAEAARKVREILENRSKEETPEPPAAEPTPEPVPEKPEDRTPPEPPHNPHVTLSRALADRLKAGEKIEAKELFATADQIHGGTRAQGKYGQSDAYDSLESAVNRAIAGTTDPRADLEEAQQHVAQLDEMTAQLPTQTNRSGNKDAFQQFSTPPSYSYAVVWAAGIRPGDTVLEPSAGTGSLAIHAKNAGAEVYANELDDRRAEFLRDQFGADHVTTENGEQIAGILPKMGVPAPDVVVMNPPFSQTAGRMGDKKDLLGGAKHVEEAMTMLKPGGRLVSIVGGGMATDAPRYRDWFRKMKDKGFDLKANVLVNGDVYKKYGTHFDSRVLIFDKPDGADELPESGDAVTGEVNSISELLTKLEGVRNERTNLRTTEPAEPGAESPGEPGGGEAAAPGANGLAADAAPATGDREAGTDGTVGTGGPGAPVDDGIAGRGGVAADDRSGGDGAATAGRSDGGGSDTVPTGQDPGADPAVQKRGGSRKAAGGQSRGKRRLDYVANTKPPVELELEPATPKTTQDGIEGGELKESLYEKWTPQVARVKGARPHPSDLVESAAMAGVTAPSMTFRPMLSPDVLDNKISEAQLENIVYAGQAHEQFLDAAEGQQPYRRGFFIGDGTGSAKGRQIAGIISDSWNRGRKKSVWLSKTSVLGADGARDLADIGMDPNNLITFEDFKKANPPDEGTLFLSYDTLRDGPKDPAKPKNLQAVVDWLGKDFDGVIAFDEAHLMGNAIQMKGKRGTKEPSQRALAGVELQKLLPNARIVYSSATGATEVANLAYADRLGIWGRGTAFPTKKDFIQQMSEGGIAAMEAVAQSLKATGSYAARSLSMDGVEHERMSVDLTPKQTADYDKMADAWSVVLNHIDKAVETVAGDSVSSRSLARKNAMGQFWGAQQRFFNQVITSMQTPAVIEAMEKDLAEGRAPVVGIVNTMEAAMKRAKSRQQEGDLIEDMDVSPAEILMQYLEKSFPVHRYEDYVDENGNTRSRVVERVLKDEYGKPKLDAHGNPITEPVVDPEAVAKREEMLDMVGSLVKQDIIPQSPLDRIIKHFGVENVAEATGRTQRVVHKLVNGKMQAVLERRDPKLANDTEAEDFQSGKKKILIFSDAGGTGRSYHASRKVGNQGRRVHYMLQPGWRADAAMQALGRTHRTNQSSAPIYRLPAINQIRAQKRFISTIARRLDQLGALGRGQRQTGGGGMFAAADNLESPEAADALDTFFQRLRTGRIPGLNEHEIMGQMGFKKNDEGHYPTVEMPQFLNRMLSLRVGQQGAVMDAFEDVLNETIENAIENGTIDTGMENYKAHNVTPVSDDVVYMDPASGASTRHIVAHVQQPSGRVSWDNAHASREPSGYWRNRRSKQIWAAHQNQDGTYNLYGPAGTVQRKIHDWELGDGYYTNFEKLSADEAKNLWDSEFNEIPEFEESDQHFVTGALLPVWDKLPKDRPKVYRVKMGSKTIVGRHIPSDQVNEMLERMGASGGRVTHSTADVHGMLSAGKHHAELANGWKLTPKLVQGERRIELTGPEYAHMQELMDDGVLKERINYQTRYFVPTGPEGRKVLERITKFRPISKVEAVERYSRQAGTTDDWKTRIAIAVQQRLASMKVNP